MRFGVCCLPEQPVQALEAGFDYVELPAGQIFMEDPIPAEKLRALRVETTNLFALPGMNLLDPGEAVRSYGEEIIGRASEAGVEVMVIGSGGARRAGEEWQPQEAEEAFAATCGVLSVIGRRNGVVIAPESLRREETNVGNSLGALAQGLAKRGVAYTADSYHLLHDWKFRGGSGAPDAAFWEEEIPFLPAHIHLATLEGRSWRVAEDGDLAGFVRRLDTLGYDGRISLECVWRDWGREIGPALAEVKALFGA